MLAVSGYHMPDRGDVWCPGEALLALKGLLSWVWCGLKTDRPACVCLPWEMNRKGRKNWHVCRAPAQLCMTLKRRAFQELALVLSPKVVDSSRGGKYRMDSWMCAPGHEPGSEERVMCRHWHWALTHDQGLMGYNFNRQAESLVGTDLKRLRSYSSGLH